MQYDALSHLDNHGYHSLVDIIEKTAEKYADKTAYACLGKHLTFAEVETMSRNFAAYLQQETSLNTGDRIAIILPNISQFIIAAYGALRAGMVLVNTNPMYTEREFTHQLNDSGAKAAVVLSDLLPSMANYIQQTGVQTIISTHALDLHAPQCHPSTAISHIEFNHVIAVGAQHTFQRVIPKIDDLALLQYTGGTTGLSKGAMLTHGNLIANTLQTKSRLAHTITEGQDIFVAPLPIYHIYAFMVNLVLYFEVGACSVLIPNPRDIDALIKTLSQYPFTGFAGLNTLFVGLCHQPDFKALDFSHLKLTISGGTALTKAAAELWRATTGCTISEGYGLSETSPVVALNAPQLEQLGTIGKPVIATDVQIVDMNDTPVPQGITGELTVKGPQAMQGYWNKPEETRLAFTESGYFKTGDIAIELEHGFLQIVDRKKDMILVSGFNVYPNEIENVLTGHTSVLECAVIGVPDEHTGEAVKAVIVLRDSAQDKALAIESIEDYCRQQLTAYKLPKIIEFVDQLPKSTVGKILRRQLRDS
ncbi:AMP-binding protein [Shewanella gelidii]|uniref:Long-chain-fatty-acid--CoA ligase n=1 Tax=Shewanella gelidii TaxID=1642821 RepID=A0A917JR81_9GAMM|nr:AMP-binding protein [Shewanella gelidii]MCL1099296.1 AMP-binding protein [Shewanella gelidii]GGI77612.1 long-chain-fatty-acid--CoA ligase [Shewanella gelidii]